MNSRLRRILTVLLLLLFSQENIVYASPAIDSGITATYAVQSTLEEIFPLFSLMAEETAEWGARDNGALESFASYPVLALSRAHDQTPGRIYFSSSPMLGAATSLRYKFFCSLVV